MRSHPHSLRWPGFTHGRAMMAIMVGVIAALSEPSWSAPAAIRSRTLELHYQLSGAGPATQVELWYTRDRAATWHKYGADDTGKSPFLFTAPAEGLYGFTLIARDGLRVSEPPPSAYQKPQRWVFVDDTPPLAQWNGIEPGEDFATRRTVQLRWTAYDDHLDSRPISLAYQSSVDQQWRVIEPLLPNLGRYDWALPADVTGQITFRLTVRDLGGHVVERLFGPMSLPKRGSDPLLAGGPTGTAPAAGSERGSDPLLVQETSPHLKENAAPLLSVADQRRAEELCQQGSWHLTRGQYALAAERFREALDIDPKKLQPLNDLAGIQYLQKDYDQAITLYQNAIQIDGGYQPAMRGAALAYVAKKEYAQSRGMLKRLLAINNKDAEALLDLGDVLFMMGDRSNARQQWMQATTADRSAEAIIEKARRRLELYGPTAPNDATAVAQERH